MHFSIKGALLVTLILMVSISACSARIVRAPLVVNPPSEVSTSTLVAPATAVPLMTSTSEPTITPTIEICQTSRVKALPEYNESGLLKSFLTNENIVVLTIDDGYNNEVLNQMLDILEENDATATFFLVGTSFATRIQYETFERLVENGNDIAYHSHTHPEVSIIDSMTVEDWMRDYQEWSEALRGVIGDDLYDRGVTPYVRAPWGRWTPEFMQATSEQGFFPVYWSADEHTFETNRMPLRAGSILILHIIPENLDELQLLMETDWQVISLRDALGETCK